MHLQVAQWKNLCTNILSPTDWGWYCVSNNLQPIKTDLTPAPSQLLKFIRCNCNASKRNPCGGLTCSCRKHGLRCVVACGGCRGEFYSNKEFETETSEEDDDDIENIFEILDNFI